MRNPRGGLVERILAADQVAVGLRVALAVEASVVVASAVAVQAAAGNR